MKTFKIAPVGVRSKDGRLIALDAEPVFPEVFPVRLGDVDGYGYGIAGYGERARIEGGWIVADFTLKSDDREVLHHELTSGERFLPASFGFADFEEFPEAETVVMIKGELNGVVILPSPANPWATT